MKKLTFQNIHTTNKSNYKQSGFSLIEVMVSAVILSIGILGVAGLQIIGMKGTQQSYMKQQASAIVHDLTERMHSNKTAVVATTGNNYVIDSLTYNCATATLPACSGSTATCSSADIAKYDLNTIICGYKAGTAPNTGGVKAKAAGDIISLVDGKLSVSCPDAAGCITGSIRIDVRWTEGQFDSRETVIEDSIVLNTRIAP